MRPAVRLALSMALAVVGIASAVCGVSIENGGWPGRYDTVDHVTVPESYVPGADFGDVTVRMKPGTIWGIPDDNQRRGVIWIVGGVVAAIIGTFWVPDAPLKRRRSRILGARTPAQPRGRQQEAPMDGESV